MAGPKILHFALTSDELVYPYYLSIVSALKTQNIDEIMLWCYKEPTGKYYPLVKDKITLHIVEKPVHPGLQGKDEHFQSAHRKDLLEWEALYVCGGIFFDLDTFSLSDASYLLDGSCEMVVALEADEIDSFVESLNMAIVMAEKESQIIKAIWTNALVTVNKKDMDWNGTAGRFSVVCKAHRDKVKFTAWGVLGGWGDKVVNVYSEYGYIWSDALILHLYAKGMTHEFKQITEEWIATSNAVLARRIREVLTPAEYAPTNNANQISEEKIMPTSSQDAVNKVMHLILERKPQSIFDVGIGFGKYGMLCREWLDVWNGRHKKEDWKIRIDGIEICQEYRTSIYDFIYDKVIFGSVMDHLDILATYDLVLLNDVIEHLPKDDGQRLLDAIKGDYIVSTPKAFWQNDLKQWPENERHLSLWEQGDFPNSVICGSALVGWRFGSEAVIPTDELHIPSEERLVHFCTTGPDFPYMYYISILTALKAFGNQVILWVVQEPQSIYFDLLRDQQLVEIRNLDPEDAIPDFPGLQGKGERFKYTAIFDYLIWRICHRYGGILMGLDSLTLKAYWDLIEEGKELFAPRDAVEALAFAMEGAIVRKGSNIAKTIIDDISVALNEKTMNWGDSGITPYIETSRRNIKKVSVGEYGQVGKTPTDLWKDDGELMHSDTRSFSLYDMSSKASDVLSEQYVRDSQSLYARLVRNLLKEEECMPTLSPTQNASKAIETTLLNAPVSSKLKRFHLIGLPHLPTNQEDGLACAYTQKVFKMGQMLKDLGHEVIFYGVEGSTVKCDEFVQVSTKAILKQAYGDYDYRQGTFRHDMSDIAYITFNSNAIGEIKKRMRETDFLLLAWGGNYSIYKELATRDKDDSSKLYLAVESGIGYDWTFAKFRVFESSAWYHQVLGLDAPVTPAVNAIPLSSNSFGFQLQINKEKSLDGNNYDVIIPNFFDENDFEYSEKKGDYFLYLGRLIRRKGIDIAIETTRLIGAKLVIAGQPGERINLDFPHVEYVGYADHAKRKELLKNAKALFVPTRYIEPFGGVTIEAALSGTPVITSDWGAFPENVLHSVTGFRCRNMDHYTWAAKNIFQIKPIDCYNWAINNFSLERVSRMYEEYFQMIMDIKVGKGWYELHPERTELDWLRRYMP